MKYNTFSQVKVAIISEANANMLMAEKQMRSDHGCGEIMNNTGVMEYDQTTGHLSLTFRFAPLSVIQSNFLFAVMCKFTHCFFFRNMQLKKIKRAEKKGSESVVDEKFSLYFSSKFSIGPDTEFNVSNRLDFNVSRFM